MDVNKALEAADGFKVLDGPFLTGGASSPVGLDLPVETIYCQVTSSGTFLWRKYNTGVNDWTRALASDFYQFNESLGDTTNTSNTTYVTKTQIVTPALPLGDYKLDFKLVWRAANANRAADIRVTRNGALVSDWIEFTANVNANPLNTGFFIFNGISGVNTFNIDFRVGPGSGTTITVNDAQMTFKRLNPS